MHSRVGQTLQLGWFISLRYEKEKIAVELSDLRGGPLDILGGGVSDPKKNSCKKLN